MLFIALLFSLIKKKKKIMELVKKHDFLFISCKKISFTKKQKKSSNQNSILILFKFMEGRVLIQQRMLVLFPFTHQLHLWVFFFFLFKNYNFKLIVNYDQLLSFFRSLMMQTTVLVCFLFLHLETFTRESWIQRQMLWVYTLSLVDFERKI